MAQAGGAWYFTDGLDFAKGGHVWRTNGTTSSDITDRIRGAGLNRVDDIVSNGTVALFLQDVAAANNSFGIVSYDGTSYVSRGDRLRAWFDADEGIASITGSETEWAIVTTKGKIRIIGDFNNLRSRPTATSGQEPATPVADIGPFSSDLKYNFRHASPADQKDYLPEVAVPYNGGWFLAFKTVDGSMSYLFYSTRTGSIDMSDVIGNMTKIHAVASNGMSVLLAGSAADDVKTDRVLLLTQGQAVDLSSAAASVPFKTWNRAIIGWNGMSWMILSGKNLVRLQDGAFQDLGKTRDYFLNIAGSADGSFLLGGVVSDRSQDAVPSRLTAKLVRVNEK